MPWGDDLFGLSFQGKGVHGKKDFVTPIEMIMGNAKRKCAIGRMWKWQMYSFTVCTVCYTFGLITDRTHTM